MKTKKLKENWSENEENRWTACHEFTFELSHLLRVYISPKKARKVANKLFSFIEDETRRFEGFNKKAEYLKKAPVVDIV